MVHPDMMAVPTADRSAAGVDIAVEEYPTAFGPGRALVAGPAGGVPVLLVHGYGASANQWRPVMAGLARRCRVYAPDLLGFGLAPKPPAPYTPQRWADQIAMLCEHARLDGVVLAGHSLGGLVALTAAQCWPERVAGLGLLDTLGVAQPLVTRLMGGIPNPLVRLLHRPGLGERVFFALRGNRLLAYSLAFGPYVDRASAPPDSLEAWLALIHQPGAEHAYLDVLRRLHTYVVDLEPGELAMPALIIWGAADRGLPVRLADDVQRLLPQARRVIIPRCGHVPHLECPAVVLAALEELVAAIRSDERHEERREG